MAYYLEHELSLPVANYTTGNFLTFGQRVRRRVILWATHLGDDVEVPVGAAIATIGAGEIVWSQMRLGSRKKRNWGGIIVIKHQFESLPTFYSLYGHLTNLQVQTADQVRQGQQLGVIAAGNTPENGYWQQPHLHFGIYTGPWRNEILPGYKRPEEWRTKLAWWHDPRSFIEQMNKRLVAGQ